MILPLGTCSFGNFLPEGTGSLNNLNLPSRV